MRHRPTQIQAQPGAGAGTGAVAPPFESDTLDIWTTSTSATWGFTATKSGAEVNSYAYLSDNFVASEIGDNTPSMDLSAVGTKKVYAATTDGWTGLTGLVVVSLSVTHLDIGVGTLLSAVDASVNALPEAQVDDILVTLAAGAVERGTVDVSGGTNAVPSAAGLTAKATLEGRSWTVTVNS